MIRVTIEHGYVPYDAMPYEENGDRSYRVTDDYPDALHYDIDKDGRLEVRGARGGLIATYDRGAWKSCAIGHEP